MKVIIYSTPSCPFCKQVKQFFDDHGVEYTDYDVSSEIEKQHEMYEKSNQMGVPVVMIDDEVVIGFDQKKLKELLKI
ncbi:MAG: glutaredoxin family protein [Patescibacteria group bacterium]